LAPLDHPKFMEMINIASRAMNGVTIPHGKNTRDEIMKLFHQQMDNLRTRFRVSKLFS
ncbi:hypothetical protein C8R45DRAFT_824396, partial [Mycena sanguinolenta]